MGLTNFPNGVLATPNIGSVLDASMFSGTNNIFFVDGDVAASRGGLTPDTAFKTIQEAVNAASAGAVIYIATRTVPALGTDPANYAETITIPNSKPGLSLIGIGTGRTQGGLPQIKKGSGSTALITVRAPGCLIANLGINGIGSTGGGIMIEDDGGTNFVAFGLTIQNCHIKNCVGSSATDGRTGGGIMWKSNGTVGAWQVRILGNLFYKNVGDIVTIGAGQQIQDLVIEDNVFMSASTSATDINLYIKGGPGSVVIRKNTFGAVPALAGGSMGKYMDLTGYSGTFALNTLGCTGRTFGASQTDVVPATIFMSANWQESGLIART